jgi:hypothetical protein
VIVFERHRCSNSRPATAVVTATASDLGDRVGRINLQSPLWIYQPETALTVHKPGRLRLEMRTAMIRENISVKMAV